MSSTLDSVDFSEFITPPCVCPYLPDQTARLHYRIFESVPAAAYEDLLCRGWRRFGRHLFRPVCQYCVECRSLRLPVESFKPSRSQRRAMTGNEHIEVVVQVPTVTDDHIALYNTYHAHMQNHRGWRPNAISKEDYADRFLAGDNGFAREFLYFDDGQLVGVGLADVLTSALSSVYFFYDPQWRSLSPGTFSVMQQMRYTQQHCLRYQYLGYCVAGCQSSSYKSKFRPHEILERYPADNEEPVWTLAQSAD